MDALVSLFLVAAVVPAVSSGPELVDSAALVEADIAQVTVYSDRARVRRRGKVKLKAGIHAVRLPDLPGGVMLRTVRVGASGAKVLRLETVTVERERMSIEQVDGLIEQLETLTDDLAGVDAKIQLINQEVGYLQGVSPRAAVDEKERVNGPRPNVDPEGWTRAMDFLSARKLESRGELRKLSTKRSKLQEEMTKLQREVQRFDLGGFTDRKVQVLAILDAGKGGRVSLELEYFVGGASWHPAYDIRYSVKDRRLVLETNALVQQATGEEWSRVELLLSTAIPGQSIELPELLTWTLGEQREFVPQARPEKPMRVAPKFPPPSPGRIAAEAERAARTEVLRNRLSRLQALARLNVASTVSLATVATLGGNVAYGRVGGIQGFALKTPSDKDGRNEDVYRLRLKAPAPPPRPSRRPRSRSASRGAPAAAPSMAMEMPYEADEIAMAEATPTGFFGIGGEKSERVVRQSLGLFDPTTWRRRTFSDPTLPAVVAGGLDYVYPALTRASIPSNGERLRVPLASNTWPTRTHYEATPAIKKTAYLTARVKNGGRKPILAGPVNIFVGGDFTGDGKLETTGPGGEIQLPLGADEDIRIVHHIAPQSRTEGFFSKDEITVYDTKIEIANHKKIPIELDVFDVLPMTNNEDMKVTLGKVSPKLAEKRDAKGRLRWRLKIPAGKTRTITYSYSIERPENWQLYQK